MLKSTISSLIFMFLSMALWPYIAMMAMQMNRWKVAPEEKSSFEKGKRSSHV